MSNPEEINKTKIQAITAWESQQYPNAIALFEIYAHLTKTHHWLILSATEITLNRTEAELLINLLWINLGSQTHPYLTKATIDCLVPHAALVLNKIKNTPLSLDKIKAFCHFTHPIFKILKTAEQNYRREQNCLYRAITFFTGEVSIYQQLLQYVAEKELEKNKQTLQIF